MSSTTVEYPLMRWRTCLILIHPYPSLSISYISSPIWPLLSIDRTPMSTAGLASEPRRSSLSTLYWSTLLRLPSLSSIPSVEPTWVVTHLMKPVYAIASICLVSVDLSLHHHDHYLCETCCCSCQLNAVLHCLYCTYLFTVRTYVLYTINC